MAVLVAVMQSAGARPSRQAVERPLVYSADPRDPWNAIFSCLFTRRFEARLSEDFEAGAPFSPFEAFGAQKAIPLSTRLFERFEMGDRAIEPLYPSFLTSIGPTQVLTDPLYSHLKQALTAALESKTVRPALDRALMQCDVWAAHDVLMGRSFPPAEGRQLLHEHLGEILELLARFAKKLALTPGEIDALPDNYAAALRAGAELPRLFDPGSGWIEIQWYPDRVHDHAADFRRVARVFIRPAQAPRNKQEFLNSLRSHGQAAKLDAVALLTQNLLVDATGRAAPSRLTYELQVRRFVKDDRGALAKTELEEYELSRQALLTNRSGGGLVRFDDKASVYLPEAGNDYGFASLVRDHNGAGLPIVVSLRSRCTACHGQNQDTLMTFSVHSELPNPVTELSPLRCERAAYVAGRKITRDDFKALSASLPVR